MINRVPTNRELAYVLDVKLGKDDRKVITHKIIDLQAKADNALFRDKIAFEYMSNELGTRRDIERIAKESYQMADIMMEARSNI